MSVERERVEDAFIEAADEFEMSKTVAEKSTSDIGCLYFK